MIIETGHLDSFCREHLPPPSEGPRIELGPDSSYPQRLNAAAELLGSGLRSAGEAAACHVAADGSVVSYGDVATRTARLAHVLTDDLGLLPGQRVLLAAPNSSWTATAWLAILLAGGVPVTVLPELRVGELRDLIEPTCPALVLCHPASRRVVAEAAGQVRVQLLGGGGPQDVIAATAGKRGDFRAVDTAAEDVALLAPTSGTTARPKITAHTHRDILAVADAFGHHILAPGPADQFVSSAPLAFTFGLGGMLLFPMRHGSSSLLVPKVSATDLARLCDQHGSTILFTAPTAYRSMLRTGTAGMLSGLRRAVSSGEHLPAEVWEGIHDQSGVGLINALGATETLHAVVATDGSERSAGALGHPVPGYRVRVVGPDGTDVRLGESGRLWVRGPTGARYLRGTGREDGVVDGWTVFGDLVRQDGDGCLRYAGRADSLIISSGYTISSFEVESALIQHPDVAECAIVGRPDDRRGSIVRAFVVLENEVDPSHAKATELKEFVRGLLAEYKNPREILFMNTLPRSPTGKIRYAQLDRVADTRRSNAPGSIWP